MKKVKIGPYVYHVKSADIKRGEVYETENLYHFKIGRRTYTPQYKYEDGMKIYTEVLL